MWEAMLYPYPYTHTQFINYCTNAMQCNARQCKALQGKASQEEEEEEIKLWQHAKRLVKLIAG